MRHVVILAVILCSGTAWAETIDEQVERLLIERKYAEAEPLAEQAIAQAIAKYGLDHSDTAMSLNNLASLYDTQGKYDLAEPLYKRALAIVEKALGPDHWKTVMLRENLAAMREARDKAAAKP